MHHRIPAILTSTAALALAALVLASLAADSTNAPPVPSGRHGSISVRMAGFRNDQGTAQITLFRDARGFPDNAALAFQTNSAIITNGQAAVVFADVPFGDYAVGVLHDENRDGRMETSWLGVPREGYGASNNARGKTGAPSFAAARFKLEAPALTLTITITY